jgi:hypothetical protein
MATPVRIRRAPGRDGPIPAREQSPASALEIVVLHTTTKGTLRALGVAADLAKGLARIRLLVVQVVPYPLPLDTPQVSTEFMQHQFRTVASNTTVETYVDIRLGRDKGNVLALTLEPRSVIVVACQRRWWTTEESRLAKRLERLGHQVVFVDLK